MPEISQPMIDCTYFLGVLVAKKELTESDAALAAYAKTNMNLNSAKMYIRCVTAMLCGESFGRTVNGQAIDYYLGKIYNDFGKAGLSRAVSVVNQHISCQANPLLNIREIVNKYDRLISQ